MVHRRTPLPAMLGGMESAERRAVVVLLLLGLAGQGVRWALGRPGRAPRAGGAPSGRAPGLSRPPTGTAPSPRPGPWRRARRSTPTRPRLQEMLRLPRVGPALARTILADREAKGPFGSLAGFDRVPGVGPKLLESLKPYLRFRGGAGPPPGAAPGRPQPPDGRRARGPPRNRGRPGRPDRGLPRIARPVCGHRGAHARCPAWDRRWSPGSDPSCGPPKPRSYN